MEYNIQPSTARGLVVRRCLPNNQASSIGLMGLMDSCVSKPFASPLPPPFLLKDVYWSQETSCDRSDVAPTSCSLWPCCEQSVMSCLSLCLSLALPEGPRGADCGSDGSAAQPHGHDPPGPGPVYLPASAADADNYRGDPRSSGRLTGLFAHPNGYSCQEAGAAPSALPRHTAGHGQGVSHMPANICTRGFTLVHTQRHAFTMNSRFKAIRDSQTHKADKQSSVVWLETL